MSERRLIASGKTKQVFVDENPKYVRLEAIDRLTAGDAAKIAKIDSIGAEKTTQCANIFTVFEKAGLKTAFVEQASPVSIRCHAVDMLPLEFVMRRYPYGSYLKRNPHAQMGDVPAPVNDVICEIFHKTCILTPPLVELIQQLPENDARAQYLTDTGWPDGVYTDPYIKIEDDNWAVYDAKKPVEGTPLTTLKAEISNVDLDQIWNDLLIPAFTLLEEKLKLHDVALVDIKFEIDRRRDNGDYVISDVVDNDSWRIWPKGDPKAQLDKQGFREGDDLDKVLRNYKIVTAITEGF